MYGNMEIPLGRDANFGRISVDTDRFSDEVQRHIYEYGLRQILNDAMASKKNADGEDLSKEEIVAKSQKRLNSLYNGDLRARSEQTGDPIERLVHTFAKAATIARWQRDGKYVAPKAEKNKFLYVANVTQTAAGKLPFKSELECLKAYVLAAPKQAAKWRALARDQIALIESPEGEEDE